jgi:hypothetical protein
MRRSPYHTWRVTYKLSHGHTCTARTRGHAVSKFRRRFPDVALQTDNETGGWRHVSAEVVR